MINLSLIISIVSILGLITGVISPNTALCWLPGERSRLTVLRVYLAALVLSFVVYAVLKR